MSYLIISLARHRRDALSRAVRLLFCLIVILLCPAFTGAQGRPDIVWMQGGHSEYINQVAYALNAPLLATSSNDGTFVDAQSSRWRFVDDTNYNEHRVGVSLLRLSLKSTPRLGNGKAFGNDRSLHWEVAIRNLSTSQTIIIRSGSEISVVQFHDPVWDASDYRTIRLPIPLRDPRAGTFHEDPSSITVRLGDLGAQEVLLPILPEHTKVVKGEMPWGDRPALIRPEIPTFRSWHVSKLIVGYHATPARHAAQPRPARAPLQPGMIVISPAITVRVNGRLVRRKVDYTHQTQGSGH